MGFGYSGGIHPRDSRQMTCTMVTIKSHCSSVDSIHISLTMTWTIETIHSYYSPVGSIPTLL